MCIPKIPIIPSAVTGLRFPLRVAFAMTVSRAQEQVLIMRLTGLLVNNYMWCVLGLEVRKNRTDMPQQDVSK